MGMMERDTGIGNGMGSVEHWYQYRISSGTDMHTAGAVVPVPPWDQ